MSAVAAVAAVEGHSDQQDVASLSTTPIMSPSDVTTATASAIATSEQQQLGVVAVLTHSNNAFIHSPIPP
eukprot:10431934-Ditylum_brightwellii.AAC.1